MKIVPIIQEGSACSYHRVAMPMNDMGVFEGDFIDKTLEENLVDADIVFFSRELPFDFIHLMLAKAKYGFKIAIDLDDFWELHAKHFLNQHWKSSGVKEKMLLGVANADIVTCTTQRLYDKIHPINKNVYVVPNGLPFDTGQFIKQKDKVSSEFLRIVYCAGSSHYHDLLTLKPAFEKIARTHLKQDVQVILAGFNPEQPKFWNQFLNVMSANKKLFCTYREGRKLESYMELYDNSDVAIAPLEKNEFNSYKSILKILEAGCKGIPIVVANVPPYSDVEAPGVFKYNSANEFYDVIDFLNKNRDLMEREGDRLASWVRQNYSLHDINAERQKIFNSLL